MKQHLKTTMKCILLILAINPMISFAQTKNVISTERIFAKRDKVMELEKALGAHAQKYHKGNQQWHVFAIQTGPDAGGYQITEGPTSWEAEDTRGNLGEEHTADWNKNIAIHLIDRQSGAYSIYIDSLSTVAIDDFSEKVSITHVYPKIGKTPDFIKNIMKLKKMWITNGMSVAIFASSSSGVPHYSIATRYKNGLKEKVFGYYKPFSEMYETANGIGSYAKYLQEASEFVEDRWEELLFMRKDLSTK